MQIGFYTAIFGDQSIEGVARWAARAGFPTLELDVASHMRQPEQARAVVEAVRREGVDVCAFSGFGNLLDADRANRDRARALLDAAVDAAMDSGVRAVVTFPGRDDTMSEGENYRHLADYFASLAERAAQGNVKVLIENWPGPHSDFVATTPAGWARLFELTPAPNVGLNFDPSHLLWQGINPELALREVADRVFLAHAKDMQIYPDRLQQAGYFGTGWWSYRLPGRGRIDWRRWLALLREVGFDGVVSIEHEDSDYGAFDGPLDRRQAGLLEAQRILRESWDR